MIVAFSTSIQEFDESGDPEKHFQALLSLAKEGVEKGKVQFVALLWAGKYCVSDPNPNK